jgi:toxin FitB
MSAPVASCDTSVLVAAVLSWHPHHDAAREALHTVDVAVPTPVVVESYSVLTRMPGARRLAPDVAFALIDDVSTRVISLPAEDLLAELRGLSSREVSGGSVYDALIAATARAHQLTLLTMDRRARRTYDAVGAEVRYVG